MRICLAGYIPVIYSGDNAGKSYALDRVQFLDNELMFVPWDHRYGNPPTDLDAQKISELVVGHRGQTMAASTICTPEEMLDIARQICEAGNMKFPVEPYLTVSDGRAYIVAKDGSDALWLRRGWDIISLHRDKYYLRSIKKCRWPWKTFGMDKRGGVGLPFQELVDRINADLDVFADPFAQVTKYRRQYILLKEKRQLATKLVRKKKNTGGENVGQM